MPVTIEEDTVGNGESLPRSRWQGRVAAQRRQPGTLFHWNRPAACAAEGSYAAIDHEHMSGMIAPATGAGARPAISTPARACSAGGKLHPLQDQRAVVGDAPGLRKATARSAGCRLGSDSGTRRRRGIATRAASSSSGSSLVGSDYADFTALQGRRVYSAATGAEVELASLWRAQPGTRCIVVFLTHFADLSSTELAQKLLAVLPEVRRCHARGGPRQAHPWASTSMSAGQPSSLAQLKPARLRAAALPCTPMGTAACNPAHHCCLRPRCDCGHPARAHECMCSPLRTATPCLPAHAAERCRGGAAGCGAGRAGQGAPVCRAAAVPGGRPVRR